MQQRAFRHVLHTSRSSHWKNGLSPEADFGKPTVFRKLCTTCSHSLPFERHTRRHPVEQCCPYQDVLTKDKHTRRDFLSESLQGAATSPAELSHVMVLSERPRPTPHGHLQKEKQSPLRLITAECFFFFFFVVGMFPSNRILPSVDP